MTTYNNNHLLNEINAVPIPFTKLDDIEVGKKNLVRNIERITFKQGERIVVRCDDLKFSLPVSWNMRMTADNIKLLLINKPLYVVYNGKVPLTDGKYRHDIKFMYN